MPPTATAGGIVTGGLRSRATIEPSGRPAGDWRAPADTRERIGAPYERSLEMATTRSKLADLMLVARARPRCTSDMVVHRSALLCPGNRATRVDDRDERHLGNFVVMASAGGRCPLCFIGTAPPTSTGPVPTCRVLCGWAGSSLEMGNRPR